MAHGFTESPDGLHYAEHITPALRLFVGLIGLAMFAIPVPFVLHAHPGLPGWQLALAAFCVVVPCLIGLLFLSIALGRCLRLHFDPSQQRLWRTSRWPLGQRHAGIDVARLQPSDVLERASEEGPTYVVRLAVRGERPMHLGGFDRREEAQHWCDRIAAQCMLK